MKKIFVLIAVLGGVCLELSAQPGVFAVHEASGHKASEEREASGIGTSGPDASETGHLLTMEEAVLGNGLRVKFPEFEWLKRERKAERAVSERIEGLSQISVEGKVIIKADEPGIVYGETVSRNEFGIDGGLFWSPDSLKLAFYRKDEREVTDFPLLDITTRTGTLRTIKYPMAGMTSELISLGVYDLRSGKTVYMNVEDFTPERYLTNISWTPDSESILIQVLARNQKEMRLNRYDASTGEFLGTVLTETNDRYVEPSDPVRFIRDGKAANGRSATQFIYRTDNRDGFRNLYLCDLSGRIERLTRVDADVEYISNDGKWMYYYSSEVSPIERHIFRTPLRRNSRGLFSVPAKSSPERLTEEPGWHDVLKLDTDSGVLYEMYSSLNVPHTVQKLSLGGKAGGVKSGKKGGISKKEVLFRAEDPSEQFGFCEIDLGTVRSADGRFDNYYRLIKPKNFDPSKKYPVILYVYGGPHSQLVNNSWLGLLRYWEMLMAQRGYLVYVQDNRGTQYRGAEFEKAIWRQCGKAEMEDQMEGINMLKSLPYVDADRIGVHGWSYGGFMTISLMTTYPETFKVGVAGGPVIDWKWYEVMYGERYMDNPAVNPEGYESTSLIGKAENLKGKLLICQGAIDDTVVWEHSLSFIQKCIDLEIPVDYFPYPTAKHNVFGRNRIHLMDKVSEYFNDYL